MVREVASKTSDMAVTHHDCNGSRQAIVREGSSRWLQAPIRWI